MKRLNRDQLMQIPRPDCDPIVLIDFCLDRLNEDKTRHISLELAKGLTYEDVIGTLLSARDVLGSDPQ